MGARAGSQSLKSPTSATEAACGATNTNWRASVLLALFQIQGRATMRTVASTAATASRGNSSLARRFGKGTWAISRIKIGRASCRERVEMQEGSVRQKHK